MSFNYQKSITHRLTQAAKAYRGRSGAMLSLIGLHPGQDAVLKALADEDGQTMSGLAGQLGVRPPTVTKMVTRLGAQGLVRRETSAQDGRSARVYLTESGHERVAYVNKAWKRVEREALAGIEEKDRRRLRKLLKRIERNLALSNEIEPEEDETDATVD
ncbi:MarR family winged helix-turn-helix transcriptional regulator [Coralliovum pocilloporae]|uniref:MarR family winged helix-turn-helix transcriptional regulator n=1 Tax=Coralliovum pocilloporae TaxID=3066369 RepID=UPI0033079206